MHTLVLDADAIPDIDYTGAKALSELLTELEKEGIHVGLARASAIAHHDLRRSGLLDAIGPNRTSLRASRTQSPPGCRPACRGPATRRGHREDLPKSVWLAQGPRPAMLDGCPQP